MAEISYSKVALALFAIAAPSVFVWLGIGEALRVSEKPSEYIGLTFSILAASLFAVISIVGDPSMLLPGNWRMAWQDAKDVQLRLMRLTYLFVVYLLVLFFLVFSEVVDYQKIESLYFIHSIFGWFSIFAFILSICLPFEIKNIQISRLEMEIEARRGRNGSKKST
tara:strand:- start:167 stop:664 length:498 start_codon:yes stop_codon:yes gene_type:complete